jgi:hypothetical protein
MKVITFVEKLTNYISYRDRHGERQNTWEQEYKVDDELNNFLQTHGHLVLNMTTHVNTINRHNNGGYDVLVKTTIITLKGEIK